MISREKKYFKKYFVSSHAVGDRRWNRQRRALGSSRSRERFGVVGFGADGRRDCPVVLDHHGRVWRFDLRQPDPFGGARTGAFAVGRAQLSLGLGCFVRAAVIYR